ncbi:MAG: site-specific integrase [Candidatus Ancillula sp.]|nr:site-specific integrase [Candidatus Ancillula sp.]
MAKAWITDLWVKKNASANELSSLGRGLEASKVKPENRKPRYGIGKRWQVGFFEDLPDGSKRASSKKFSRKSDAEDYCARISVEIQSGTHIDKKTLQTPFHKVAMKWFDHKKVSLRPVTYGKMLRQYKSKVQPKWGKREIGSITSAEIDGWVQELIMTGLSASTIHQFVRCIFGAILSWSANPRQRILYINPFQGTKLPSRQRYSSSIGFLHKQQLVQLADTAEEIGGLQSKVIVYLLAFTGMRIGELCALQIFDVDFARNRISITKTTTYNEKGKLVIGPTKTGKNRKVPIPVFLKDMIHEYCREREADDFLFSISRKRTTGLGAMVPNNIRTRVLNPAIKKCNFKTENKITIHSLRHTCAAFAIDSGCDVKTLQNMLGHQDAAMTLNIYAGFFPDNFDELAKNMSSGFEFDRQS